MRDERRRGADVGREGEGRGRGEREEVTSYVTYKSSSVSMIKLFSGTMFSL